MSWAEIVQDWNGLTVFGKIYLVVMPIIIGIICWVGDRA